MKFLDHPNAITE